MDIKTSIACYNSGGALVSSEPFRDRPSVQAALSRVISRKEGHVLRTGSETEWVSIGKGLGEIRIQVSAYAARSLI